MPLAARSTLSLFVYPRRSLMWFMIVTAVAVVWPWLPLLTVMLKFCTALIGFVVAVSVFVRRIHRWSRRHR
jgi:membrane protein implicated in regulation of membrane protease activity